MLVLSSWEQNDPGMMEHLPTLEEILNERDLADTFSEDNLREQPHRKWMACRHSCLAFLMMCVAVYSTGWTRTGFNMDLVRGSEPASIRIRIQGGKRLPESKKNVIQLQS